jgi:hypothetical protein
LSQGRHFQIERRIRLSFARRLYRSIFPWVCFSYGFGGFGNEVIVNFSAVMGNVDLGDGRNGFGNEPGTSLRSGATVVLGGSNPLENRGVLSPGGDGVAQTIGVTGNLLQTNSGVYRLDLEFAGDVSDRLAITGEADLDGEVDVNTLDVAAIVPGTRWVTILTAAGGVTDSGLSLGNGRAAEGDRGRGSASRSSCRGRTRRSWPASRARPRASGRSP